MSAATPSTDENRDADDVRPIVPTGGSGKLGLIAFLIFLALGGAWIISLMTEQRTALGNEGPLGTRADPAARISSPPPLALPQSFGTLPLSTRGSLPPVVLHTEQRRYEPAPRPSVAPVSRVVVETAPSYSPYSGLEPPIPSAPAVTFSAPPAPSAIGSEDEDGAGSARVRAGRFANPSLTVPQGAVIPAVLETALDSTRPGGVRALVQRNIHAFDGSRVLIPRGSRLYGEYDAELQRGQNRALIRWSRLIRPDGVTIALDSPASDPLGRAGVKGKVDGKFFQRFGGALLQSVLDIGVGVATREVTDGVIVALPGSTQNVTPRVTEGEIRPTLKVRHGTSVSVFVARDLDFSSVDF
ncbi:conjugal transfer protein TrbI [Qipengyuania citrea]|jgi:type IV secretion system protein VirB10|uniref:Conjugal transfer protein TrbI n=1 Tax=Qipengyuania citrea TaxID=225971 RepID=A0ABY4U5I0_9SPHN|nr:TrbI/VirB10 family protein [Qipengyuania citrea]USA61368.1 conjugal transfer protein TrbI [Qipengyuania citrea]